MSEIICECNLYVEGDSDALRAFIKKAKLDDMPLTLNSLFPSPSNKDDSEKLEWRQEYWGVIYDIHACHIIEQSVASIIYHFRIPSPPLKWLSYVSRMHRHLTFGLDYDEIHQYVEDWGGAVITDGVFNKEECDNIDIEMLAIPFQNDLLAQYLGHSKLF